MRTIYLPIHVTGTYHARSVANKRGLYDALSRQGETLEIDYCSLPSDLLDSVVSDQFSKFQPDLLWLQFQGATAETAEMVAGWRRKIPTMRVVNWNGDYWPEHLTGEHMLAFLRHVDLQLVANGGVLEDYAREGIPAAFCAHAYEFPQGDLPDVPEYDVVFLANSYNEKRRALYDVLRSLPYKVGIYGTGWPQADGECNYDFAYGEALYRRAKIAISHNQFPDSPGYMSDRPFQAMGAGGAMLIQEYVPDLERMTGMVDGWHYYKFVDTGDLCLAIGYWLQPEQDALRAHVAARARQFVLEQHTWDNRVEMVLRELAVHAA